MESIGVSLSGNFSFVEVNYQCVIAARLKQIFRANTIASSIFRSPDSSYNLSREEPLMAPVIASATLYCTDLILFEDDDGWS